MKSFDEWLKDQSLTESVLDSSNNLYPMELGWVDIVPINYPIEDLLEHFAIHCHVCDKDMSGFDYIADMIQEEISQGGRTLGDIENMLCDTLLYCGGSPSCCP